MEFLFRLLEANPDVLLVLVGTAIAMGRVTIGGYEPVCVSARPGRTMVRS